MDLTLLGVVIGAILILILIRGLGFYSARSAATRAYRRGMNEEITRPYPRQRFRATGIINSLTLLTSRTATTRTSIHKWRKSVRKGSRDGSATCLFKR